MPETFRILRTVFGNVDETDMNPEPPLPFMTESLISKPGLTTDEMDIINVSSRGQIVIPEHVRKKLGIKKGTRLVLRERKDTLVLTKESNAEKLLGSMDKEDLGWLLLAEQGLAKEWNTPEEDEAWKDL